MKAAGTLLLAALFSAAPAMADDAPWNAWDSAPAAGTGGFSPEWLNDRIAGETNSARLAGLVLIRFYQVVISPGLASRCPFHPSCSRYAFGAIADRGLVNGTIMGAERILRCNGRSHLGGYPDRDTDGRLEDPFGDKPSPIPLLSALGL